MFAQLTLPLIERLDWSESTRRQFFSTEPGAVSMLALVDPTSRKYLQLERAVFERAIGLAACSCCSGLGVGPGASPAPSRSATSNTSVATGSSGAAATDASTSVARVSPPRLEPQHGTLGRPSVPAKGPSPDHEVGPNETPLHVALFGTPPASSSAATSAQRVLPSCHISVRPSFACPTCPFSAQKFLTVPLLFQLVQYLEFSSIVSELRRPPCGASDLCGGEGEYVAHVRRALRRRVLRLVDGDVDGERKRRIGGRLAIRHGDRQLHQMLVVLPAARAHHPSQATQSVSTARCCTSLSVSCDRAFHVYFGW